MVVRHSDIRLQKLRRNEFSNFVLASTLVTPSQTDIAKACAVVDTLKDENLVTQIKSRGTRFTGDLAAREI